MNQYSMDHYVILGLGSNTDCASQKIEEAVCCLGNCGMDVEAQSEIYTIGLPYYNKVVLCRTNMLLDDVVRHTKDIERELGRDSACRCRGVVPIDIDVVIYDGRVYRPGDYCAYYFQAGYDDLAKKIGKK